MPEPLSQKDWEEIMKLPEVIDAWQLDETDTVESFSKMGFAAKFTYEKIHAKDYCFYILTNGFPFDLNMVIERRNRNLSVLN